MPHSMKYPTTWLPRARAPAVEFEGPAAASGAATASVARVARAVTRCLRGFMFSLRAWRGVGEWFVPIPSRTLPCFHPFCQITVYPGDAVAKVVCSDAG